MNARRPVGAGDPLWYKDAIIYEVPVRAFRDANGDGKGDFRGLTGQLDYLADLGVSAIWVLPFYPSPGRDDGYDIADFTSVNPDYGSLRDVKVLIREAHARGLKVITELVCNHTSDQHPWFQRARRAKPGSAARDFYVWSDTPDRYQEARIIFKDFETSNWTWDPVAGAYFWHRFYSHQPDLNFDNPKVGEAIFDVMDQWLEMGIDGLRLDAIPYLYEREGTNCENLPETHAFLKALRAHIDAKFPDRMLLAEANQWPEDSVEYFGDGDECNMAFHFPVMPRMFMAIRMEDRFPIVDILAQTPPIPENAQWALFLRNHDELTLEMVTDEERDYMYRAYAADPQARINLGIRRRLAPLLGNNRRRIELMNGLLFALPGTPVLYYGDEIGMGDNVYLGDRNGVRTPMQWSGDRNAGFSSANRQSLYLPVIVDPEYHYEAINVEAQQANRHSLLWWTKRLIALRKRHAAFGRGTIEFLQPDNRRILAFVRRHEDQTILIVANLSRFAQHSELDLSAFEDQVPVEMFGRVDFPVIRATPWPISLGPHAFLWFELERATEAAEVGSAGRELPRLPGAADLRGLVTKRTIGRFTDVLESWVRERRWFRGKARRVTSAEIVDWFDVPLADRAALAVVLTVSFAEGDQDQYLVPVMAVAPDEATQLTAELPGAAIATIGDRPELTLVDAMRVPAFAEALLEVVARRRTLRGAHGQLAGRPARSFAALRGSPSEPLPAVLSRAEQSNSSVVLGDRLMLKLYRRLEGARSTDLEVALYLTNQGFPNTPPVAGSIEYRGPGGAVSSAAMLSGFVPNEGTLWEVTVDAAGDYLERAAAERLRVETGKVPSAVLLADAAADLPSDIHESVGVYLDTAWLVGRRTGEMHMALGRGEDDPAFTSESFTALYQRSLYQSIRAAVRTNLALLRRRVEKLPAGVREIAERVLANEGVIDDKSRTLVGRRLGGKRIRIHGDYHLGQILHTGRDIAIIDFEGEPGRPIGERRLKRSPLTDVASMLRSFDYGAREATVRAVGTAAVRDEDTERTEAWARHWYRSVAATFLRGYREATAGSEILPTTDEDWTILLDALVIQKAIYELDYELNNRPDWVGLPLRGILELVEP